MRRRVITRVTTSVRSCLAAKTSSGTANSIPFRYNRRSCHCLPVSIKRDIRIPLIAFKPGQQCLSEAIFHLRGEDREKHIPEELEAFTEYTITDRRELDEEIRMVRERGYAVDDMEVMFGVKCVGVALLNHEGEAEGALSISAPSLRMNKENIQKYAEILKTSARKIQKLL